VIWHILPNLHNSSLSFKLSRTMYTYTSVPDGTNQKAHIISFSGRFWKPHFGHWQGR
jgi:hypothetical protein